MKKHSLYNRILSGILSIVTLISLIPMQAFSEGPELPAAEESVQVGMPETRFQITVDGEEKESLTLRSFEKIEISADGLMESAQYQWQILHPEKPDVWVSIYGATDTTLPVTLALVKNMLDGSNTTQLRCRAIVGDVPQYTPALTVAYDETAVYTPVVEAEPVPETTPEEVTEPTEATEATEPIESTEATETIEPTEVPETIAPTETIEVTEPTEVIETTEPVVPETIEVTEPAAVTEPTETAVATEPTEVTEPTEPAETQPATEAVEPVEMTEPAEETTPVEVTEPAAVSETTAETEPALIEETVPAETVETTTAAGETTPAEAETEETSQPAGKPEYSVAPETATLPGMTLFSAPARAAEDDEFVKVTIEYVYFDYKRDESGKLVIDENGNPVLNDGVQAFNPYVATLQKGTGLNTTVPVPTMVGYEAFLEDKKVTQVDINLEKIQDHVTYTVKYLPAQVSYTVRYYFQNVYDDLYVENTVMKVVGSGFTGGLPNEEHLNPEPDTITKDNYPHLSDDERAEIQKDLGGFLSLYYQPDYIAADGSTVFEVYYERNYYLMEFDCNGGYGTDTLYVRYGTYISVPQPVKVGWVFDGWDLVTEKDADGNPIGDGQADTLPETMPPYNVAYKAIWKTAKTTYTVAYWIENEDGSKSYLGSRLDSEQSGKYVSGSDDLTATTALCDYPEHFHTQECYSCEHEHGVDCDPLWAVNQLSEPGEWKMPAMKALGEGEPENAYLYLVQRPDDGKDYYIKFGDKWYGWSKYDGQTEGLEGDLLKSATIIYEGKEYTAYKYRISGALNCGHNHDGEQLICNAHSHSSDCYVDDFAHLQYSHSDQNVLVDGDGSTVVNVYYEYKTYRLKFYYAAANGDTRDAENVDYRIVGGCAYFFGGQHDVGNYSNYMNSTTFDMLERMFDQGVDRVGNVADGQIPSLKENVINKNIYDTGCDYYNGRTYYYISFTARFNDTIADRWPADVFDAVEVTADTNTTHSGWSSNTTATVSAWNGEHHVWYSRYNANETIKGKYEKLDYKIVYDSEFTTYPESTDSTGNNPLPTISYLCFWENGAVANWNVPELYRYNIYLEALPNTPKNDTDIIKARKNDQGETEYVRYYLEESFDTCDDSDVNTQTQTTLEGFKDIKYTLGSTVEKNAEGEYIVVTPEPYLYKNFEYQVLTKGTDYSGDQYYEGYSVNFYYDRIDYVLNFVNHGVPLMGGDGATVPYGKNLGVYGDYVDEEFMAEHYPDTLEPGAYEFTGWYTTAGFLEGTRIDDWSAMTMPASDMVVYARWEPVKHDILFFTLYDDIEDFNDSYPGGISKYIEDRKNNTTPENTEKIFKEFLGVSHGKVLETFSGIPSAEDDPRIDKYTFIGWFYMDEDNKKRFAPDSMEITRDLVLFAEWTTTIPTTYEVRYVLEGEPETEVAPTDSDHSSVGKTKTFTAKGGTDLYETYRKGYFPMTSSHSILMNEDSTDNTYTFEYVHDEKVWYKVRYLEVSTNKVLAEELVESTDEAVITKKFRPIEGYIPQNYYIRKALVADGNATADNVNEANVITFYYVKDEDHGLYSVEYYLENADSQDATKPENYSQYESIVGSADIDAEIHADVREYEGYTHVPDLDTVTTYDENGNGTIVSGSSGQVTQNGLTIKLYYKRNSYPYVIEYREYGAADTAKSLRSQESEAKFGTEIEYSLVEKETNRDDRIITVNGNTYEYYISNATPEEYTKSTTIRAFETGEENPNKLIFYFIQKKVEVFYHAVCTDQAATDFGVVSLNSETASAATNLAGSTATAKTGFKFKGWYKDKEGTDPVDVGWLAGNHLTPKELNQDEDWENHYYALFEPVRKDLKIVKNGENLDEEDSFIFTITGKNVLDQDISMTVSIQGEGNVTIQDLYCGNYTVTETNWSWGYSCTGVSLDNETQKAGNPCEISLTNDSRESTTVTFTNAPKAVDWLHGESCKENVFDSAN